MEQLSTRGRTVDSIAVEAGNPDVDTDEVKQVLEIVGKMQGTHECLRYPCTIEACTPSGEIP